MNTRRTKLTKTVVQEAATDASYIIWDSIVAGFGLRVRKSGHKSFVFIYRSGRGRAGKVRTITIKATNPDVARSEAKALAAAHHGGKDPAEERQEKRREARQYQVTVGDVLDRFLSEHVADRQRIKAKTAEAYRDLIARFLKPAFGHISIGKLRKQDVAAAYEKWKGKPTQAAQTIRILSSCLSRAEEWGYREAGSNPAKIKLKATRARNRLFSDSEVARMLAAADELEAAGQLPASVALGVRMLFATGCRADEVCTLEWEHVDFDQGILRWRDSKTGFMQKPITEEVRPLLEAALKLRVHDVDGASLIRPLPWVFPSPKLKQLRVDVLRKYFKRVMRKAGVEAKENAALHLVRHWFSSKTYGDRTIPLPQQMKLLGHASVATALRYSHVSIDELKSAGEEAAKRRRAGIDAARALGEVRQLDDARKL